MNILKAIRNVFQTKEQENKVNNHEQEKPATKVDYLEVEKMRQALDLLQKEENDAARELFAQEVAEHPDNCYALYYLSMLDCTAERYGIAMRAVNDAIRHLQHDDNWLAATISEPASIRAWIRNPR